MQADPAPSPAPGPIDIHIDLSGLANLIWSTFIDHIGDLGNAIWTSLLPRLPDIAGQVLAMHRPFLVLSLARGHAWWRWPWRRLHANPDLCS